MITEITQRGHPLAGVEPLTVVANYFFSVASTSFSQSSPCS